MATSSITIAMDAKRGPASPRTCGERTLALRSDVIGFLDRIKQVVAGDDGDSDNLDEATLRQTIVERILTLRQRGPLGVDQLPQVVEVSIAVANDRSVDVVRAYVDDPAFDDEIGASLANRLVGLGASIPLRLFTVGRAATTTIAVHEAQGGAWAQLRIEGGDRDGEVVAIAGDRPRYHLGRGTWHGDGEAPLNDVVISSGDRYVSRRTGVLRRAGSGLELTSLDQGEFLIVLRPSGQRVRPTHARSGRIRISIGDRIEVTDGGRQRIVLHLERQAPTNEDTSEVTPTADIDIPDAADADDRAVDEQPLEDGDGQSIADDTDADDASSEENATAANADENVDATTDDTIGDETSQRPVVAAASEPARVDEEG